MINNFEYAKDLAVIYQEGLTRARQEGTILKYVDEHAIEIEKDSGGKPTKIIFTAGGPYSYFDFFCDPGSVVVYFGGHEVKKRVSNDVLEQIVFELEGLGYGC